MDKQRLAMVLPPVGRAAKGLVASAKVRQVLWQIALGVLGYGLATATLFEGAHPLGLAWGAALCPLGGYGGALGAFLAYGLMGVAGLPYCAALLVCATCALVFYKTQRSGGRLFLSFCAFFALLCTGSAGVMSDFSGRSATLLLCETLLCGSFTYLYGSALQEKAPGSAREKMRLTGLAALFLSVLLVLEPWQVFGMISPARVGALLSVVVLAHCAGPGGGAAAGVFFGAALDLASGMNPHFAGIYGFAGLIAGMFRQKSRLGQSVGFVLGHCAATLWALTDPRAVAGLYECFCASVFFLVLPGGALGSLRLGFAQQERTTDQGGQRVQAAGLRLRQAAQALESLSMALGDATDRLGSRNEGDISLVFHRAADRVCAGCPVNSACWDREYVTTLGALNDVTQKLRQQGKLDAQDYPNYFAARCICLHRFVGAVNDSYGDMLRQQRRQRARSGGAKQLLRRQYEGVQGVLRDMEAGLLESPDYYPALQNRAQNIAAAYFRRPSTSLYTQQGRMHCEIRVGSQEDLTEDAETFARSLSLGLGRAFGLPQPVASDRGVLVRCSQRERYRVEVHSAQQPKAGQQISGDQLQHFTTEDGRMVVLLADGMGSGPGAAAVSADTLGLIAKFAQAGCSLWESARAVTPMLAARLEERGFVTLDLLEINLFSGRCALTKYGAAPSWLLAGGRARKFASEALPAGLDGGSPPPEPEFFTLEDTCTLIMASDGVADALDGGWFVEASRQQAQPEALAQAAIAGAICRGEGPLDDMSALVISIHRNPEE